MEKVSLQVERLDLRAPGVATQMTSTVAWFKNVGA